MAYGLKVYADKPLEQSTCVSRSGTWDSVNLVCTGYNDVITYSSEDDKGFVYIGRVDFGTSGSGAGTYTITAPDITEITVIYHPYTRNYTGTSVSLAPSNTSVFTGRPDITVGTKSGDDFPITVALVGASNMCMDGGSLEIFGR